MQLEPSEGKICGRLCYSLGLFSILCYKYIIIFPVWVPEQEETIQVLFQVQTEGMTLCHTVIQFNSVNNGCGENSNK